MGGWRECQECGDDNRGGGSGEEKAEGAGNSDSRCRSMGQWHERMGGCFQIRWGRKAKKRRLLLIIAMVL